MDDKTFMYIVGTVDGFLNQFGCSVRECPDGEHSLFRANGDVFGCVDAYGRVIVEGVILDGLALVQDGNGWDVVRIAAEWRDGSENGG